MVRVSYLFAPCININMHKHSRFYVFAQSILLAACHPTCAHPNLNTLLTLQARPHSLPASCAVHLGDWTAGGSNGTACPRGGTGAHRHGEWCCDLLLVCGVGDGRLLVLAGVGKGSEKSSQSVALVAHALSCSTSHPVCVCSAPLLSETPSPRLART